MGDPRRHPAYSRGEGLTPENVGRIDRLASRLERVSVEGMDADFDDAGLSLRSSAQPGFWARITAKTPTSQALYSWEEVTRLGGSSAAYVTLDGGLSGAYDGGGAGPAREVRDRPDVPADPATGQIAWLTLSDDGESFDFAFGGIAEPTPFVLTAREVDGSPSVSPVTVIEFDQSTGARITDQTGGVARYENVDASPTQTGVVNKVFQRFAGLKYFEDSIQVQAQGGAGALIAFTDENGSDFIGQLSGFGPGLSLRLDLVNNAGAIQNYWQLVASGFRLSAGVYQIGGASGQSVTDSGVTYTGGIRTGGTLAVPGSSLSGTIDGGAW